MTYRATRDIIIPAGTVLEQSSRPGYVEAIIGHGADFTSRLVVQVHPDAIASGEFERAE